MVLVSARPAAFAAGDSGVGYDKRGIIPALQAEAALRRTTDKVLRFDAPVSTPYAGVMLDSLLRRRLDGPLAPVAAWLAARKIKSWTLTVSAFLCTAVAMLDIGHRTYLAALALLVIAGAFDLLDGPVARQEGTTPLGATLDRVLSVIAAAGLAFAFALAEPDRALAAMFLMLGLVARTAALSEPQAGWSVVGKTELFIAFALACLFPAWFSILAYAVGILCFVAAGTRVAALASQAP